MALLHWYIVPIAWELKFDPEVVKNFAIFSNVVEYAMTAVPRTQDDLTKLYDKIVLFLRGFEHLYVGDNASKITHCRLCVFQLIHIPHHIAHNGSIRFGSQATCERAIGDIGHGIRSKKSPFKNIVSYKTDKQSAKLLNLSYPTLSSVSEGTVQRTSLFKEIPITQKQKKGDNELKAHLDAIRSYLDESDQIKDQTMRWGKCLQRCCMPIMGPCEVIGRDTACPLWAHARSLAVTLHAHHGNMKMRVAEIGNGNMGAWGQG
jgi:hypothetical protein